MFFIKCSALIRNNLVCQVFSKWLNLRKENSIYLQQIR